MTLYDYWSPAGRTKHTYVRLAIVIHCQSLAFFKFVNGILRNWESLCDIRPDCHHHFDVSRFSRKVSDESLGRDEAYVCKASHNREIKFDVTWSYVKRQTAKMKLLPSVFSSLNSRMKIFVFVAISRRHFSNFMWFNEGLEEKYGSPKGTSTY